MWLDRFSRLDVVTNLLDFRLRETFLTRAGNPDFLQCDDAGLSLPSPVAQMVELSVHAVHGPGCDFHEWKFFLLADHYRAPARRSSSPRQRRRGGVALREPRPAFVGRRPPTIGVPEPARRIGETSCRCANSAASGYGLKRVRYETGGTHPAGRHTHHVNRMGMAETGLIESRGQPHSVPLAKIRPRSAERASTAPQLPFQHRSFSAVSNRPRGHEYAAKPGAAISFAPLPVSQASAPTGSCSRTSSPV